MLKLKSVRQLFLGAFFISLFCLLLGITPTFAQSLDKNLQAYQKMRELKVEDQLVLVNSVTAQFSEPVALLQINNSVFLPEDDIKISLKGYAGSATFPVGIFGYLRYPDGTITAIPLSVGFSGFLRSGIVNGENFSIYKSTVNPDAQLGQYQFDVVIFGYPSNAQPILLQVLTSFFNVGNGPFVFYGLNAEYAESIIQNGERILRIKGEFPKGRELFVRVEVFGAQTFSGRLATSFDGQNLFIPFNILPDPTGKIVTLIFYDQATHSATTINKLPIFSNGVAIQTN